MSRIALSSALIALPLIASAALPAEARIACVKGMQVVSGQLISTPYCQDALVADVARAHGMKVSADAVRNNPNLKRSVCRLVHADIRVSEACINEQNVHPRF